MKGVDAETFLQKNWRPPEEGIKQRGRDSKASKKELNPMALGVLNNLSAIYAENNLNNTNNSLQTVLQQLSSGSRINSGADDAAGLSLVNGLAANSAALTQSGTNATEGVGLLDVADGALSQVTSLLDRAITLATEASNGTLNPTQEGAANQEYQSILAEINNIGSTTTYNQQAVFSGNTTAIYTGDSSTTGSSIDDLNIRTLSESSVGDTGGTMSYSSRTNNIFVNLSTALDNAQSTDKLGNGLLGTTLNVNYLVKGAGNSQVTATAAITVGGASSYPNTVDGLISAINASGLGLTASFTTAQQAGGVGNETGIEITGAVGFGVDPSSSVTSGTVAAGGIGANDVLTAGKTLVVQVGSGAAQTFTVAVGGETLTQFQATIAGTATGFTSTVVDNGDGTQSLELADNSNTGGALAVTSNLTDVTVPTATVGYTPGSAYNIGVSNGTNVLYDNSSGQTAAAASSYITDANGSGGIAVTSYSDGAGQALNGTDLVNQTDAQNALTVLNNAITDVAAQDGYIGAEINTLNSISQVMSTQKENVVSAQNAIQATDYASATSNMSKYEILSQTGIAALAQANSVQQEVTKLLQ
jgi:flagellin